MAEGAQGRVEAALALLESLSGYVVEGSGVMGDDVAKVVAALAEAEAQGRAAAYDEIAKRGRRWQEKLGAFDYQNPATHVPWQTVLYVDSKPPGASAPRDEAPS